MKKIIDNFKGHYRQLILGPAFKLFEAVLELFIPIVMANIIDIGIAAGNARYIITNGLIMLGLGILGFCAAMICQYYAAVASGAIGRSLRNQVYRHCTKLGGGDIAAWGTGGLITRLTGDVNQIQTGINMAIRLGSRVPFLAIGSVVMAMRISPQIGSIFLLTTPLIVLVLYGIMRRTLPGYARVQEAQDALSQQSAENLAGTRVIRAFSMQEAERDAYAKTSQLLTRRMIDVGRVSALLSPLTSVIANAAIIAIVWTGAQHAYHGRMLSGEIIALVSYMTQTLLALIVAANLVVLFTRALASARRVNDVLETPPGIVRMEMASPPARDGNAPLLRFDVTRFAYPAGGEDALSDIHFSIGHGEMIGMIGGTGSGKSTVINLIMRYFDPQEGGIRLEGEDIRALEPEALRGRIGLAPQKAVLFAGTIRHNLAIAAPEATDAQMWHALKTAQCADFVEALAGGLGAAVHQGGMNLSGGQRQRLTVARALVRRPQLLILDDAASALDYATDAALRAALDRERTARPDMGMLIVSQRAASLMHADRILVLDDGQLRGVGTHEELLRDNDIYREICHSQGLGMEVMPG